MEYDDYFWKASVADLKQGFFYNKTEKIYTCLICGKRFEKGFVYPAAENMCSAKKAVQYHIREAHNPIFEYFLDMGKIYTSLTERQKELMKLFYAGYTDKDIVEKTEATNTSTIRNQRFVFKEKYKQAKIIVAIWELLEEQREITKATSQNKNQKETLIDIHRTATMVDDRYVITQAEREEVLHRYFDKDNALIIKDFPAKEKKKIIILQHIMKKFEPRKNYTEKEVNSIISQFYNDMATVRRYLVQYGFLDRSKDGHLYWLKQ